jgi:hypothetical protein
VAWQQATHPVGHQGHQAPGHQATSHQASRPEGQQATRPPSHQATKATNQTQQKTLGHQATKPPNQNHKQKQQHYQHDKTMFLLGGGLESGRLMTKCLFLFCVLVWWLGGLVAWWPGGLVAWQQATRPAARQGHQATRPPLPVQWETSHTQQHLRKLVWFVCLGSRLGAVPFVEEIELWLQRGAECWKAHTPYLSKNLKFRVVIIELSLESGAHYMLNRAVVRAAWQL